MERLPEAWKDGESTFVALQFYYAMTILKEFAAYEKDEEYISYLEKSQEELGKLIEKLCWNEDRFIRGFTEAGEIIGQRTDPEANMWLNPQSWAVISGLATKEQSELALEQVYKRLNTEYGAILMDPPYHAHAFDGALAVIYNAGTKENAGIFSQSQGWIILAEALMGHGERAFGYFMENAPAAQNDKAEIRRLEPYCYGQFTEGKASPNFGRSHVHWLTGTASTVMVGCVEAFLECVLISMVFVSHRPYRKNGMDLKSKKISAAVTCTLKCKIRDMQRVDLRNLL